MLSAFFDKPLILNLRFQIPDSKDGGEGGIRTHGTVPRSQHFQCCQFNHSCTSPGLPIFDCQLPIGQFGHERVSYQQAIRQSSVGNWQCNGDSNPRNGSPFTAFPVLPIQPLLHLSEKQKSEPSAVADGWSLIVERSMTNVQPPASTTPSGLPAWGPRSAGGSDKNGGEGGIRTH